MWRIISLESRSAAENMAIDETIGNEIYEGISAPTIRFYTWKSPAVSIGYFQCIEDELDLGECRARSVEWVRRRTGGGAVYHDPRGEITYSIIAPERYFPDGITESYKVICESIIRGLAGIGIEASFRPVNDVVVAGRKISGSAQTRRRGVLTQHGTVLYKLDRNMMFSVLKPSSIKLTDKPIKTFEGGVTSVSELCSATRESLYDALLKGFTAGREWQFGMLTDRERMQIPELTMKYSGDPWNLAR